MKYIRTKDNIFDIEKYGGIKTIIKIYDVDESLRLKYADTNEPQQVGDKFVNVNGIDYKITATNVADTIEELCDEFVVEDRDEFAIFHNLKLAKQTKGILYGAIWTDKGLIYVAKMNEKGELELL